MKVLLSLCEEEDEEGDEAINQQGVEDFLATSPTIPSVLLRDEDKGRGAYRESEGDNTDERRGNVDPAGARRREKRRKARMRMRRGGGGGSSKTKSSPTPACSYSDSDSVGGYSSSSWGSSGSQEGQGESMSSERFPTAVGEFVSKDGVFRAVLRQMKWGTPISKEKAAEV